MSVNVIRGQTLKQMQSVGRALRRAPVMVMMENQLGVPFISKDDMERLKKLYPETPVNREQYGEPVQPYTLH